MYETSKSLIRRSYDKRFATRWLVGTGIDIGAGLDPLGVYAPLFPLMGPVRAWDMIDGDAMLMEGVADRSYDFVNSSHCLEHLADPGVSLQSGHLLIIVPDEDLYEQGVWPSMPIINGASPSTKQRVGARARSMSLIWCDRY